MNFASELGTDKFVNRKLYELSSGQEQPLGIFTVLYWFDGIAVLNELLHLSTSLKRAN